MIRALFLLAITVLLIASARSFLPQETSLVGSGAALAFGFVLLAALQTGTIVAGLKLPRLTGYLLCGFLAGPSVLNFVTERMLLDMKLVNNVAISLIALSAGAELNFKKLRPRLRAIMSVSSAAIAMTLVLCTAGLFALTSVLPFARGMGVVDRLAVSLSMAVVLSALSPTVTLAIINETGSDGLISEVVLGIVVVADLALVFSFAGINAGVARLLGAGGGSGVGELLIHIFGSIGVGAVLGIVFYVYKKKIGQRMALFVFGVCFLSAEIGTKLHLDPLLMCLTAGLFIENVTDIHGASLLDEIQPAAMPVFALFFAVAGAGLHWHIFREVALFAFVLSALRALALYSGAQIGMRIGQVPKESRAMHFGLYSQSGIAIGLSILLKKQFPTWGEGASACLLGSIMINEMVGPVLFRAALVRAGEAGKRTPASAGAH